MKKANKKRRRAKILQRDVNSFPSESAGCSSISSKSPSQRILTTQALSRKLKASGFIFGNKKLKK